MDPPYVLGCSRSHERAPGEGSYSWCAEYGGFLEYTFDPEYLRTVKFEGPLMFWRYVPVMPRVGKKVSLGEGVHRSGRRRGSRSTWGSGTCT